MTSLIDWVSHAVKYAPTVQPIQLTPEEKEKLEELGYIR